MNKLAIGTSLSAVMLMSASAFGQTLFSEDFTSDVTASWTVNVSGATDNAADFFFDYSTVSGVPAAPNSDPLETETRGMQLRANEFFNAFGGFSVSPTGLDLGTGDYTMSFDWWANSIGGFPIGGSGSTQTSTFGVLTSGAVSNEFGANVDGVMFAATGDGNSSADYRAYSSQVNFSHQSAPNDPADPLSDPDTNQTNGVDVYFAPDEDPAPFGSNQRNNSNPYYAQFGGVAAPAAQQALFPGTQDATLTNVGSAAFAWHEVEITKVGNVVTWFVDALPIAQVDTTLFAAGTPFGSSAPTAGTNISFGHHDVNGGSSSDPNASSLLFTLIDNIKVEVASALLIGDLDADGFVGITDLNIVLGVWNTNVTPGSLLAGDPSGDGFVGIEDLNVVLGNWNAGTPPTPGSVVPVPASLALLGLGGFEMLRRRR